MNSIAGVPDDFDFSPITIPAYANSIETTVRFLVQELGRAGRVPQERADELVEQVLYRESLGSTGIGGGVATPNIQTDLIQTLAIAIGCCVQPVTWPHAIDGQPVETVCLIIAPKSPEIHLKALDLVARRLRHLKRS
jgi:PTS system nitrogen regulatory IIA component